MEVSGDTRSGCLADIHPQIEPIRVVEAAQNALHSLRQVHHFVGRLDRQLLKLIQMGERHDHHVARGVRKGVEDDIAVLTAMHDMSFPIVSQLGQITEDARRGLAGARNVGVAPGSPEIIHMGRQISRKTLLAPSCWLLAKTRLT